MPETPPQLVSLCSGYGGLDLAAAGVFGAVPAFHAETDPAAARVLAHRFPGTPNLGDITAADWTRLPPVDVLTAGYPCQPESYAGKRKGVADARWIWPAVARAVRVLRPRWVLLENVPGHLSSGYGHVLADLARDGFDAEWLVLAASDLGAAHQRKRLFVLAWPADTPRERRDQGPLPPGPAGIDGQPRHPPGEAPADPARLGEREPADQTHPLTTRRQTRPLARGGGLLPTPTASIAAKGGPRGRYGNGSPNLSGAVQPARWGRYATAIARHEQLAARPAPEPTEPGPNGPRLSPRFAEWLMCLPDGWVTAVPGITRTDALRILGNGVIPPQGAAAARELARRALT